MRNWNIATQSYYEEVKEKIGEILLKPKFKDVVYSEKQEEFIKLVLEKIRLGEQINLLFSGYAGTGKTYSAMMIAVETERPFVYMAGNQSKLKILEILNNLKDNSIVCIDEIHGMRDNVAELIYPVIEYGELYIDGGKKKLNAIFICTTTEPEGLPKPLQDRLMRIEFDEPNEQMTKQILNKMKLDKECITYLIRYTLNIRILKKLIKYMDMYGKRDKNNLIKVFRMMKINIYSGLSNEQEEYINYLKKVGRSGVRNIGLVLRRSENYIKLDIEPDLIRKGMILITSRGRELAPNFIKNEDLLKEEQKYHTDKTIDEIELARQYLNDHPEIKEKFSGRYFELTQFIADKIVEGISPDEIDIESWGNDKEIKDSFKDNYLEEL